MTMNVKGWIPDSPDPRDLPYSMVKPTTLLLFGRMTRPKKVDLRRPFFPPVFDQGDLGSCVSQAWCGAMSFAEAKHGTFSRVFSRLANFLHTRELTGDRVVDKDGKLIIIRTIAAIYCRKDIIITRCSRNASELFSNVKQQAKKKNSEKFCRQIAQCCLLYA